MACCLPMKHFRDGLGNTQAKLTKYTPQKPNTRPPLVVVFALINKPYILDLTPDRSLIRRLLERGQTVYLLDWGSPTQADIHKGLKSYLLEDLNSAIDVVRNQEGIDTIELLGICQGGYFSLSYTSLFPEKISRLITLVTPIDFHAEGCRLFHLTRYLNIDALTDTTFLISGRHLSELFNWVAPFKSLSKQWLGGEDGIDRWFQDCPDQSPRLIREFSKALISNALFEGKLSIDEHPVNLKKIIQPILNIYAIDDHFWSPSTPIGLRKLHNSCDYQEVALPCGHLGGMIGRFQHEVADAIVRNYK
ncbi:MAG: alpha/beta fold hydrolase [Gammaproteobacteria bacterium]